MLKSLQLNLLLMLKPPQLNLLLMQMPKLRQIQITTLMLTPSSLVQTLISSNSNSNLGQQATPSKTQITTTTMMDKMELAVTAINPLLTEEDL